jgi:hypothetical protein
MSEGKQVDSDSKAKGEGMEEIPEKQELPRAN